MIRHAGVSVIACGVDTEEQADWWRAAGADCAVGALFGKPGPLQDIEHLLHADGSGSLGQGTEPLQRGHSGYALRATLE